MSSRLQVVPVLPKPCLKQTAHAQNIQKHAHFPPPSEEVDRRYSGIEYDRTPIVIAANDLALPARGCPGKTFDDLDAHRLRHQIKKLRCHKQQSGEITHDDSSYLVKFGRLSLSSASALPSLIHADTSESDEDEIGRPSDGEALKHYPESVLSLGPKVEHSTTGPRRLRKAHHRGLPTHKTNPSTGETTPTSIFSSCPGSNSCLGGF